MNLAVCFWLKEIQNQPIQINNKPLKAESVWVWHNVRRNDSKFFDNDVVVEFHRIHLSFRKHGIRQRTNIVIEAVTEQQLHELQQPQSRTTQRAHHASSLSNFLKEIERKFKSQQHKNFCPKFINIDKYVKRSKK